MLLRQTFALSTSALTYSEYPMALQSQGTATLTSAETSIQASI